MPGDEFLEHADGVSTRAIDIDAPPAAVWPWLAQMGPSPRGGAYTYDWIENLLGLNMHSTARVLPEFQHAIDQPQPLPTSGARGAYRHAPDGARLAPHGKENAARHQQRAEPLGNSQSASVSDFSVSWPLRYSPMWRQTATR